MTVPFDRQARREAKNRPAANAARSALPDPRERPTVTVDEVAVILGVSRGTAYAAVRDGTIASLRIGRRLVVPTARLIAMLEGGGASDRSAGGLTPP